MREMKGVDNGAVEIDVVASEEEEDGELRE